MSELSEKDFVAKLVYLLSGEKTYGDDYIQDIKSVGFPNYQFPAYDYPAQKRPDGTSISITLKSIRPPRFNTTLQVSSKDLVIHVKTQLVESVPELSGVHTSQLKVMLKTKVLADTSAIGSYVEDGASLMVMVGKLDESRPVTPASEPAKQAVSEPETPAESMEVDPQVSEEAWAKIYAVLQAEISDKARLDAYFEKIKSIVL